MKDGARKRERPLLRRIVEVGEELRRIGVRRWRLGAGDRNKKRLIVENAQDSSENRTIRN